CLSVAARSVRAVNSPAPGGMASIGRGLASDGEAAARTIATSANETIALTLLFTRPAPCRRQSKGHTDTQVPVLLVRLDRGTETPVTMRQRVSGTKTRDDGVSRYFPGRPIRGWPHHPDLVRLPEAGRSRERADP